MIETLLQEANEIADRRNDEVLSLVLSALGAPRKCKFCLYREDYIDLKILAKRGRKALNGPPRWARDQKHLCPLEEYARALAPSAFREEDKVRELFKMAFEFRKRMQQEGQCSCLSSILSPKGNEDGRFRYDRPTGRFARYYELDAASASPG